jgi:hypothetical protein
VADLGCSINHLKTFDIIKNAKFVFLNFVLVGERAAARQLCASACQWAVCQNFEPGTSKLKSRNAVL